MQLLGGNLIFIFFAFIMFSFSIMATEFNTDVLDTSDKNNIDFTRFSKAGIYNAR